MQPNYTTLAAALLQTIELPRNTNTLARMCGALAHACSTINEQALYERAAQLANLPPYAEPPKRKPLVKPKTSQAVAHIGALLGFDFTDNGYEVRDENVFDTIIGALKTMYAEANAEAHTEADDEFLDGFGEFENDVFADITEALRKLYETESKRGN